MISVKTTFNGDTRRRGVSKPVVMAALQKQLRATYAVPFTFALKYVDEDGDLITIGTQAELDEAVFGSQTLKLQLSRADDEFELLADESDAQAESIADGAQRNNDNDVDQNDVSAKKEEIPEKIVEPKKSDAAEQDPLTAFMSALGALGGMAEEQGEAAQEKTKETLESFFKTLQEFGKSGEAKFAEIGESLQKLFAEAESAAPSRELQAVMESVAQSPEVVQQFVQRIAEKAQAQASALQAQSACAKKAVHQAVCDHCGTRIRGVRYKCLKCADFDLCEACEALDPHASGVVHDATHLFVKIRRPEAAAHVKSARAAPPAAPKPSFFGFPRRHHHHRRHFQQRQQQQQQRVANTAVALSSTFVGDDTVADGTVFAPNEPFVKIWTIRNSGKQAWPQGCRLKHVGGHPVSDYAQSLPLPALEPGAQTAIAIDMRAPAKAANYISFWRMANPAGKTFGARVWVQFVVAEEKEEEKEVVEEKEEQEEEQEEIKVDDSIQQQIDRSFVEVVKQQQQEEEKEEEEEEEQEQQEEEEEEEEQEQQEEEEEQASLKESSLFKAQVSQLKAMGFGNEDEQLENLLAAHEGDVLLTVQALLSA